MSETKARRRWTPEAEEVEEQLCNAETAARVLVTRTDKPPVKWLLTLDYGWAQTIIATCDYDHDAHGVAAAVAVALDCDVEWLDSEASA